MGRVSSKKSYARLAEIVRQVNDGGNDYWQEMPGGGALYSGALRELRQSLRLLAQYKPQPRRRDEVAVAPITLASMVGVFVGEDGTFTRSTDFVRDVLWPALEGRNIDRIRICPVCTKVFVALRKDQQACRGPCTNANNARNWRAKWRENRREARKFRRKTGLKTERRGSRALLRLNEALRTEE